MSTASAELQNWLNGTVNGGPQGDGRYPLTAKDGTVFLVYCPAAQALNPVVSEQPVEIFADAAEASAAAAAQEAIDAAQSAAAAASSASAAALSASAADGSETAAADSATTASTAATTATGAKTAAETAQGLAEQWASAPEYQVVTGGKYSAMHWALQAQQFADGVSGDAYYTKTQADTLYATKLDVDGTTVSLTMTGSRSLKFMNSANERSFMEWYTDADPLVRTAYLGFGSQGSLDLTINNNRTDGDIALLPGPGGVVRVGGYAVHTTATFDPATKADTGHTHTWGNLVPGTGFVNGASGGITDFEIHYNGLAYGGMFATNSGRTALYSLVAGSEIQLRPNGRGSATGQVSVTVNSITWNGHEILHAGNMDTWGVLRFQGLLGTQDLNTITTPGSYRQSSNASASAAPNYPAGYAGWLLVESSGNMTWQRYQKYDTGTVWTRSHYAGTWSAWLKAVQEIPNGNATVTGAVIANGGDFIGRSDAVTLGPQGAGTIFLRPNSAGSAEGQMTLDSMGTVSTRASIVAGAYLYADGARLYLRGPGDAHIMGTGNGGITLRPNGWSTTGQTYIRASGAVSFGGDISGPGIGQISVVTDYGYVNIGPANVGWCHINTDRPKFYFNKTVTIDGNLEFYGGPRVPRIFVQSSDPGTAAAEGDLWIW